MIGKLARALRESEEGQALVLGALAALVLALCTFSTVQVGHLVRERIRLQDAADAAAYSSAVLVARSLNAMAWLNRSQVAQYVAAMAAQSYVAALDGLHALAGNAADRLQTLSSYACAASHAMQAACAAFPGSPACGTAAALEALRPALAAAAERLLETADSLGALAERLDGPVADFVAAASTLNRDSLYAAQRALREETASALRGERGPSLASRFLEANAGRVNDAAAGADYARRMGQLNADAYLRLFDALGSEAITPGGSYPTPYSDANRAQNAEKLMAELANATRAGSRAGATWESRHALSGNPAANPLSAVALAGAPLAGDVQGASRLVDPMAFSIFREDAAAHAAANPPSGEPAKKNFVFMNYVKNAELTRGSALASAEHVDARADALAVPEVGGAPQVVGVQAASQPQGRYHCRYDGRDLKQVTPGCPPVAVTRPVRCQPEPRHAFGGITRYLSLALAEADARFGQPDFFAFAHKSPDAARFPVDVGLGFGPSPLRFGLGNAEARLDATHLGVKGPDAGLHAWARAQVYYHRPGHWAEPPNLFNPFWRARLAPLASAAAVLPAMPGGAEAAWHPSALLH